MKCRSGFVSNSSSSSFVIPKCYLSYEQIDKIKNHHTLVENYEDRWSIDADDFEVKGYSSLDNFNMHQFLKNIGVNMDKVEWR